MRELDVVVASIPKMGDMPIVFMFEKHVKFKSLMKINKQGNLLGVDNFRAIFSKIQGKSFLH